jgi:hypothetical protein
MACQVCHEFDWIPDVAFHGGREPMNYYSVAEIEASARTCICCQILFSILDGVDLARVTNLGLRNDTRDGTFKGVLYNIAGESGYALPYGRSKDYAPPNARYTLRNLSSNC